MASDSPSKALQPFDRSSEQYNSLVDAIAHGAVLFVGAGSSCRVGYPSWGTLLTNLREAIRDSEAKAHLLEFDHADDLIRARYYREALGCDQYLALLRSTFSRRDPPHDTFHESLVQLPFSHVLTTNYDYVLESAHQEVFGVSPEHFDVDEWSRLSELRQSASTRQLQRRYVHIHGSIDRPSHIVLCQDDYDARYVHETRVREYLSQLLVSQRVVFVGYSLSDADFTYLLRQVAASLGLAQPRHFVLLPLPNDPGAQSAMRVNYEQKYHITPVFFGTSASDYAALIPLIEALREDVTSRQKCSASPGIGESGRLSYTYGRIEKEV